MQIVREDLCRPAGLASIGLKLFNLSVLAARPYPETARALAGTESS